MTTYEMDWRNKNPHLQSSYFDKITEMNSATGGSASYKNVSIQQENTTRSEADPKNIHNEVQWKGRENVSYSRKKRRQNTKRVGNYIDEKYHMVYNLGEAVSKEYKNVVSKPIESYGIILCHRPDPDSDYEFLCCQRKDSIHYTHFLRGNLQNYADVRYDLMTLDEQQRLLNHSYTELIDDLLFNKNLCTELYKNSENFKIIQPLLEKYMTGYQLDLTWEFPKGRKNDQETGLECALREFYEETKLNLSLVDLTTITPYKEIYRGSDGKIYSTVFYVCTSSTKIPIHFSCINGGGIRKLSISSEVGNMKWLSKQDCIDSLTKTNSVYFGNVPKRTTFTDRYKHRKEIICHLSELLKVGEFSHVQKPYVKIQNFKFGRTCSTGSSEEWRKSIKKYAPNRLEQPGLNCKPPTTLNSRGRVYRKTLKSSHLNDSNVVNSVRSVGNSDSIKDHSDSIKDRPESVRNTDSIKDRSESVGNTDSIKDRSESVGNTDSIKDRSEFEDRSESVGNTDSIKDQSDSDGYTESVGNTDSDGYTESVGNTDSDGYTESVGNTDSEDEYTDETEYINERFEDSDGHVSESCGCIFDHYETDTDVETIEAERATPISLYATPAITSTVLYNPLDNLKLSFTGI